MQFESIQPRVITPDVAREMLKSNETNRPLSRARVLEYMKQMKNGQWDMTHESILLGRDGVIIDGQHRLHAVAESGATVTMLVAVDPSLASPRGLPINVGLNRTSSWIMGKNQKLWQVANLIVAIGNESQTPALQLTHPPGSMRSVAAMCDRVEARFSDLTTDNRQGFSNAAVRAAVVLLSIFNREQGYDLSEQYRRLVKKERRGMWQAIEFFETHRTDTLLKQHKGTTEQQLLTFLKAYKCLSAGLSGRELSAMRVDSASELRSVASRVKQEFPKELAL